MFLTESRINLVLYRDGWGEAKWTRVEETAIKSRVLEEGWETVVIVKLDGNSKLPMWIPPIYIYVNFEKFGLEGTANIVEQKVLEKGGKTRVESLHDYAARKKKELQTKKDIKQYLENSIEAVHDAEEEVNSLFSKCESEWTRIKELGSPISFGKIKKDHRYIEITSKGYHLNFLWENNTVNSLYRSSLLVRIYFEPSFSERPYQEAASSSYNFSLNQIKERGWTDSNQKFFRTSELVDIWTKELIEIAENEG